MTENLTLLINVLNYTKASICEHIRVHVLCEAAASGACLKLRTPPGAVAGRSEAPQEEPYIGLVVQFCAVSALALREILFIL